MKKKNGIALQARLNQGQGYVMDYANQVMSVNSRWWTPAPSMNFEQIKANC